MSPSPPERERALPLTDDQRALAAAAHDVVERAADRYLRRYPNLLGRAELVALGEDGLLHAARRFDRAMGVPFDLYARYRVRGAMVDGLRVASRARRDDLEVDRALVELVVTPRARFDPLGHDENHARKMLDDLLAELADAMFAGVAHVPEAPDEAVEEREMRRVRSRALAEAMAKLDPTHRQVIELLHLEEVGREEAAARLGCGLTSLWRLEKGARARLRAMLGRLLG